MLCAGDEFMRTQGGNNNAYCQDNEISWLDWRLLESNTEIFNFCKGIIRFRKEHVMLRRRSFFTGERADGFAAPDITWHGEKAFEPDWSEESRVVACLISGAYAMTENKTVDNDLYIAFNASPRGLDFEIPPSPSGKRWHTAIDTGKPSPSDLIDKNRPPLGPDGWYHVKGLSTVVLVAE
jgi:glycogen operon protein